MEMTIIKWKNFATIFLIIISNISCCTSQEETCQPAKDVSDGNTTLDLSKMRISIQKCHEYAESVFQKTYTIGLRAGSKPIEIKKDVCGFKSIQLIVGGTMAGPREYPHMALVGFANLTEKVWSCGGTLISENYVLTAAHCIYSHLGLPKYVRIGEFNINSDEDDADPEDFNITEIIPHPDYGHESKYNDIALLKLDRKVIFNAYKRPACLPREHENCAKKVIATGWGRIDWAGSRSDHLLKVILDKFNESYCNAIYSQKYNAKLQSGIKYDTLICAGSKDEKKDTCQGDSGGPIQIYHNSEYCMYEIVGITSFGIKCGLPGVPGVFTRVFPYVEWIEEMIWS